MPVTTDRLTQSILDALPRATPTPYSLPKIAPNAIVCIDSTGRLNILTEAGLLTIDEDDLNVIVARD